MASIWRKGRRLDAVAGTLMLLTAAAHTAGNLVSGEQTLPERVAFGAMEALHQDMGMGMNPSLADIYWEEVLTMSVTFAGLGLLTLVLCAKASGEVLQAVRWVNLLWVGAFTLLSWHYRIPPPLISGVAIGASVLASLVRRPALEQP